MRLRLNQLNLNLLICYRKKHLKHKSEASTFVPSSN